MASQTIDGQLFADIKRLVDITNKSSALSGKVVLALSECNIVAASTIPTAVPTVIPILHTLPISRFKTLFITQHNREQSTLLRVLFHNIPLTDSTEFYYTHFDTVMRKSHGSA